MTLATTIALAILRGPVPLAKTLVALDVLTEGRVVAAVGPGSSKQDYDAVGLPFEERWQRFDETVTALRRLVGPDSPLAPRPRQLGGIPLWIGSWGSEAACAASAGSPTAGSPPPTTRRRSASRSARAAAARVAERALDHVDLGHREPR